MISVLFVCHGNICRSPMAEFILRDLVARRGLEKEIQVQSAATHTDELGSDIHRGTRQKLQAQQIPFTRRQARLITTADYQHFDYLIGMDRRNLINMHRLWTGDPEGKISSLLSFTGRDGEIADPWYTGNFDDTYNDVLAGCQALLSQLEERLSR